MFVFKRGPAAEIRLETSQPSNRSSRNQAATTAKDYLSQVQTPTFDYLLVPPASQPPHRSRVLVGKAGSTQLVAHRKFTTRTFAIHQHPTPLVPCLMQLSCISLSSKAVFRGELRHELARSEAYVREGSSTQSVQPQLGLHKYRAVHLMVLLMLDRDRAAECVGDHW